MALTVEDLVNQALVEIGYPARIGNMYEGSEASNTALEIYSQTRDELLVGGAWPMARRSNIPLDLLKGPPPPAGYDPGNPWDPKYPPQGWLYEYLFPEDMLELRAVLWPAGFLYDRDPRPATWRVDNDDTLVDGTGAATTQKKVILTNVVNASGVFTAAVTDPDLWQDSEFVGTLIKKLAEKLARRLRAGEQVLRDTALAGAALAASGAGDRG